MKLKIETTILKEMVSKAVKGANIIKHKDNSVSGMIGIELKSNKLTLHTTDSYDNYLYIIQNDVEGEDFYIVIEIEQFAKLISKMTSEYITLELKDRMLEVKGNGKYDIEIPVDMSGNTDEFIKFPDPISSMDLSDTTPVDLSTIRAILNTAKSSIATTEEMPAYTGYYVGDKIITTDRCKLCAINNNLFNSKKILISQATMNLLDLITYDMIEVCIQDDTIVFITPNCIVYGILMDCVDDYQITTINSILDTSFDSVCKIDKSNILAILDRISLFVGAYDKKAIRLNFTENGIDISSIKTNGIETIDYIESENFKPFTCLIDIDMFTSQIKANTDDVIELHYGNEQLVSIVNDNITQIICLIADN